MIEIGRLAIKIAGRDAGLKCVIVDILDNNFVLIDGETRRRKCNIMHIEPLKEKIDIKKGAPHSDIAKEFEKLGLTPKDTTPKKKTQKPAKKRKTSEQLKEQKEEKKKLRDMFKAKKKDDGKKDSLEEVAESETKAKEQKVSEEGKKKHAKKKVNPEAKL